MSRSQESASALTRRTALAAAGTAGLSAALAACGGSGDSGPSGDAPSGGGSAGAALGRTSEIPVGGGKIFGDEKVVVTQPEKGRFKAFSSICTHRQCQVASVGDGTINCNCHGSRFSIEDGSVQAPPATRPLPEKKIEVTGGQVKLA
ncbi:Rieske (2Fe-2S) protein [Streptomyces physcomitrii]|uniref:Rieske (2Fe-2S) protein n=1 Tax=Streptomyces physcomitrii TaxID=2724184 RepID=A0ABX1H982_9ACTN|nr:Rieske (2Fe-2S) protein [Streptomyces physcomitrii]NKI44952.1 Rieske (2Fe-2S) protein [Streptomyces physcomitrii]